MDARDEQLARLFEQAAELLRERRNGRQEGEPSHRGPTNPRHQTWRGFVLDLQAQERRAVVESMRLTKSNVCQFGVDLPRTITRTMRWYGLASDAWPPSTWDPDEAREGGKN